MRLAHSIARLCKRDTAAVENVEVVRRGFAAWDRGDHGAAMANFASDIEIDASERILNPAVYTGIDGAMRFSQEIAETWGEFHVEVEELLPAGDQVVVLVHSTGQGRASGAPVDSRAAWVVVVSEGKVKRMRLYRDRARALAAARVGVVVQQFADTNARDFRAVMEAYAQGVELVMHGDKGGILSRTATGKQAVGEWFGDWFRQFSRDYRFEIEEARGIGNRVLIVASHHGRGRDSGVPVEEQWAYLYGVRDGKVDLVELWGDRDARAAALAAVGPADAVRGHFEAFDHGGLDAVAEFWHPDVDWRAVEGAADDVGVIRGPDALRRYYQDWIDTLDELQARVEEIVSEAGERIAASVRNSGRGKASGVQTEGRYYVACTVRDGRIVSGREYETREQALEAVGSESPL